MKQQPDKIFNEKLNQYERTAPAGAWDRIESGIQERKYPYYKFAAAASLLLVCIATYWYWPQENTESKVALRTEDKTTMESNAANKTTEITQPQKQGPTIPHQEPEDVRAKSVPDTKEPAQRNDNTQNQMIIIPAPADHHIATAATPVEAKPEAAIPGDASVIPHSEVVVAASEEEDNSVYITMTSEETKNYLIQNSTTEATPDKKNTSTLKKVWSRARDLKKNQNPIGDLRQMKDELLALNFKSDKQRGQKK